MPCRLASSLAWLSQVKAMPFEPFDGLPPAALEEEDDEVAEAVLELKDVTAKQAMELQAMVSRHGRMNLPHTCMYLYELSCSPL